MPKLSEVTAAKPQKLSDVTGNANDSDFAGLVSGKRKASNYNPTGVRALDPVTRQIGAGVDALQHHVMNPIHGLAQMGGHALESAMPDGSAAEAYFHRSNTNDDAVMAQRERDYQARTGTTAGSYAGGLVGEVLPWLYGVGEAKALGLLPKLQKVSEVPTLAGKVGNIAAKTGLLAAEGAAMGAAQPVTERGDYARQKAGQVVTGAVAAPLTAAGIRATGAGVRAATGVAQHAFMPQAVADANLARLVKPTPQTIAELRNAPQFVPGEIPTLAQVLSKADAPEYMQAERVLRNDPNAKRAFLTNDAHNTQARGAVIQRLAGTDAEIQAAIDARGSASRGFRNPNLPEDGSALVDPAPVIQLLEKKAMDANGAVRGAAKEQLALIRQHMAANGGKVPAYELDSLQQEAGSTLRSFGTNGVVGTKEETRYAPVKNAFVDTLDGAVPGYRDYLATYAQQSEPINTMESVRRLADPNAAGGVNFAGDPVYSAARLKAALKGDDRANFPMSPQARSELEGVRDSLNRAGQSNAPLSASGPQTAGDLLAAQNSLAGLLFGSNLQRQGGALATLLSAGVGAKVGGPVGAAVGAALPKAAETANARVLRRLGETAADSKKAAAALERQLRRAREREQALISRVPQYLLPYSTH